MSFLEATRRSRLAFRRKYDCLEGPKHYLTFLRDPVDRVVSNYHYLRRQIGRRHPDALIVQALGFSLTEFAQHIDNRNLQSQVLQDPTLETFAFMGLVEAYGQSLDRLEGILGRSLPRGPAQNVNEAARQGYALSSRERAIIENNNRDDLRLYDLARTRFERLEAV